MCLKLAWDRAGTHFYDSGVWWRKQSNRITWKKQWQLEGTNTGYFFIPNKEKTTSSMNRETNGFRKVILGKRNETSHSRRMTRSEVHIHPWKAVQRSMCQQVWTTYPNTCSTTTLSVSFRVFSGSALFQSFILKVYFLNCEKEFCVCRQ